jgi:hypothetical protein
MPRPFWKHPCCGRDTTLTDRLACLTCGAPGTFAGWGLTMHEAMGRYQYVHGLLPVGPHRPLADRLFRGTRRACGKCGGDGLLASDERACRACPSCEGTGAFWAIDADAIEAIRKRILDEFPAAAAPSGALRFLTHPVAQDLSTGAIVDLMAGGDAADADTEPAGPAEA